MACFCIPSSSRLPSPPSPSSPHRQGKVFNVPLEDSLAVAKVNICTNNESGQLVVWGKVPAVVAKCGANLKDFALETEGVFRVPGSSKRMKELQARFETPPKYGKNLEWSTAGYTVHDVASLLRRFLTQMPEPVIPIAMYDAFRAVLQQFPHQTSQAAERYKVLITSLPAANHYLLLYLLDLLAVFAKHSDKNKMTASNLGVIFQPGIISRPDKMMLLPKDAGGEQSAAVLKEQKEAQAVLEFLVAHQDYFLLTAVPQPAAATAAAKDGSASPPVLPPAARSKSKRLSKIAPPQASNSPSAPTSPEQNVAVGKAEFLPSDSEEEHRDS